MQAIELRGVHDALLDMVRRIPTLGVSSHQGRIHLRRTEQALEEWLDLEDANQECYFRKKPASALEGHAEKEEICRRLATISDEAEIYFEYCILGDESALSGKRFVSFYQLLEETCRWEEESLI